MITDTRIHNHMTGAGLASAVRSARTKLWLPLATAVMLAVCSAANAQPALLGVPDLAIRDLFVFQTRPEPGLEPRITVSFQLANGGPAVMETFRTAISVFANIVYIDTKSRDGRPSIGAGETLYFSTTIEAPSTGEFTVEVATDSTNVIPEATEGNNKATRTSSIDRPPVNQWYWVGPNITKTGGNTGRLLEAVVAPTDPQTIFTRGERAACGIWKTKNGGATWSNVSLSLPFPKNTALAIAPKHKNRVYALSQTDGLYRTNDGGVSWRRIATASDFANLPGNGPFVISPKNDQALFFAGADGVYRSTGGGYTGTWAPYLRRADSDGVAAAPVSLALDPANGDTLYATLAHKKDPNAAGLYRTNAATAVSSSWDKLGQCTGSDLPPTSGGARIWLSVVPPVGVTPTRLFVLYEPTSSKSPMQLFRSTVTCTNPSGVADLAFKPVSVNAAHSPPPPYFAFTVNPADTSKLFVAGFPTEPELRGASLNYRSADGGENWSILNTPHADLKSYTWHRRGEQLSLIAASDGGLHVSMDNGDNWTSLSKGVQNAELFHLQRFGTDGFPPFNDGDLVAGTQDNGSILSNRTDNSWFEFRPGDGGRLESFRGAKGEVIFSTSQDANSLAKNTIGSQAGTVPWGEGLMGGCGQPDNDDRRYYFDIKAIHTFLRGNDLARVFVACQGVYVRDDDGSSTFTKLSSFPAGMGNPVRTNYNTAYQTLFVGTNTGEVIAGYNPIGSDPSREMTWKPFFSFSSLGFGRAPITDIKFDPANTAVFISTNRTTTGRVVRLDYALSGGRLQVTRFRDVTGDMTTGRSVNALAFDSHTFDGLWAATTDGVYRGKTTDSVNYSWSSVRSGMGRNVNVTGLVGWVDGLGRRSLAASVYGRSALAMPVEP